MYTMYTLETEKKSKKNHAEEANCTRETQSMLRVRKLRLD